MRYLTSRASSHFMCTNVSKEPKHHEMFLKRERCRYASESVMKRLLDMLMLIVLAAKQQESLRLELY